MPNNQSDKLHVVCDLFKLYRSSFLTLQNVFIYYSLFGSQNTACDDSKWECFIFPSGYCQAVLCGIFFYKKNTCGGTLHWPFCCYSYCLYEFLSLGLSFPLLQCVGFVSHINVRKDKCQNSSHLCVRPDEASGFCILPSSALTVVALLESNSGQKISLFLCIYLSL